MAFLFNWFVKITGWLPFLIIFRPKYYFEDKSVQSRHIKKGAIVISNHNSVWDFAVTLFTFPTRTLKCAAAELLYKKNFFMTAFLVLSGAKKVNRGSFDFSFVATFQKLLKKGQVVEIYPESRIPEPYEEKPLAFKPSTVYLALNSGAPIIPICNNGRYFDKKRTRVFIGKPIDVREMYDDSLSEKENIIRINEAIRGKIIEFRGKIQEHEEKEELR